MNDKIQKILLVPILVFVIITGAFVNQALAITVAEDYSFDGKTIHIEWHSSQMPIVYFKDLVRKGLIDQGLLESWRGEPLPVTSNLDITYLSTGAHKRIYKLSFNGEKPFVCGLVFNQAIPATMAEQFFKIFTPVYDYWKTRIPEESIPVPKPGNIELVEDSEGVFKEVFTREYIEGWWRSSYRDALEKAGLDVFDSDKKLIRIETAKLWMIWRATGDGLQGYLFDDFGAPNLLFVETLTGFRTPKYFDFDFIYANQTLRDLFQRKNLLRFLVKGGVINSGHEAQMLLGFYDAMKLDGMTDAAILAEFDTLADLSPEAVAEAKAIITEGRSIDWIASTAEDTNVAHKSDARRAMQKAMIEGDYGLTNTLIHNIFPGAEEKIAIISITGEYWYSNDIRDYYTLTLKTNLKDNIGERTVVLGISNDERIPDPQITRQAFDDWKNAFRRIDPELGVQTFGEIKDFELTDQNSNIIYRDIIAEEYTKGSQLYSELLKANESTRQALLRAQAYVYSTLYQVTTSPLFGKSNCVLGHPEEMLFIEIGGGKYIAKPLNFLDIEGTDPASPHQLTDHYFNAINEYKDKPELLLRPFKEVLGIDFLAMAGSGSEFPTKINDFLDTLPDPGSINDILKDLEKTMDEEGLASLMDSELQNKILGKTFTVGGESFTFPSQLVIPEDYENFYKAIDAILGENAVLGDTRALSEADVASAIIKALESGVTPDEMDMNMLKIVGINNLDELNVLLEEKTFGPTPKGYTLTPKKVIGLLQTMAPKAGGSAFRMEVMNQIAREVQVQSQLDKATGKMPMKPQPLALLALTEADYKELYALGDPLYKYNSGMFYFKINTIVCRDLYSYLHEQTHARDKLLLDEWARSQQPQIDIEIHGTETGIERIMEGHAQIDTIAKLNTLDNFFLSLWGSDYEVLNGLGLFGIAAKGVNVYDVFDSLDLTNWFKENNYKAKPTDYLTETKQYLEHANEYKELTGSEDYMHSLLKQNAMTPGGISLIDFLKISTNHYALRTGVSGFLAISDIAGGYNELVSLFTNSGTITLGGTLGSPGVFEIEGDVFTYTGGDTLLVFLGDYINKGTQSNKVIKLIRALQDHADVIALMGYEEAQLLQGGVLAGMNPHDFGLEGPDTLKQFGYSDEQIEAFRNYFEKAGSPRANLFELINDKPTYSMFRMNYEATEFIKWMQELPPIAKVTLTNGKSYLFMHAGLNPDAWEVIDGATEEAIWANFNSNILTDTNLFYALMKADPEEWINDPALISDITTKFNVDGIIVGDSKRIAGQKLPSEIKLVGPSINGEKRVWAINTIQSGGEAVGGSPVQAKAIKIDGAGIQFVEGGEFPSPVITNPARFTFEKDGKITITASDDVEKTILRDVFKDWYCEGKGLYVFPNGFLDITQEIEVTYDIKGQKIAPSLEFSLLTDELGSYPYYFIYNEGSVKMYYKDKGLLLGSATFSITPDNQDLKIETLSVQKTKLSQTTITETEAARALILKAYKIHLRAFAQIAGKTWLPQEAWNALQSLIDDGYVSYVGESGGYNYHQVQPSFLSASFTISEKGVPGNLVVSGPETAPTVTFGPGVKLIDAGVYTGEEIRFSGDKNVKFITADDTYLTDIDTLVYLTQSGALQFKLIAGDGGIRTVQVTSTQLTLDGFSLNLLDADVALKQFNPDPKLISSNMKWAADIVPATDAAGDVIITNAGGVPEFKYVILSEDIKGVKTGVWLDTLDIKVRKLSWQYLRNKLPGGTLNIYEEITKSAGWMKMLEVEGEVEVGGKLFNPEMPAKAKIIDMNKLIQMDNVLLEAAGEPTLSLSLKHELVAAQNKPLAFYTRYGVYTDKVPDELLGRLWMDQRRVDITRMFQVTPEGSTAGEVIVSGREVLEPMGLKKYVNKGLRLATSPAGTTALIGGGNILTLYIKYDADEYHPMDEFVGDVIGATLHTATWTVGQAALLRLAQNAGASAILGVGYGTVYLIPMIVLSESVKTYSRNFWLQWQVGSNMYQLEDTDTYYSAQEVTALEPAVYDTPYRAWLATLNDLKEEWLFMFNDYRSWGRDILEGELVNAMMERWLSTNEGRNAAENEIKDMEFIAQEIAELYGDIYQDKIPDALFRGLCWNGMMGLPDEYGWLRLLPDWLSSVEHWENTYPLDPNDLFANASPASLGVDAMQKIKDVLMKNTFDLWRNFAEGKKGLSINPLLLTSPLSAPFAVGEGKLPPIKAFLGYEPGLDYLFEEYTITEVYQTIEKLRAHLDGSWSSWSHGDSWSYADKRHKYSFNFFDFCDIRTSLPILEELLAELPGAYFADYGLYDTLIQNTDFEHASGKSSSIKMYDIDSTLGTSFIVPDPDTLSGIKYNWGVKAKIGASESPESERWGLEINE